MDEYLKTESRKCPGCGKSLDSMMKMGGPGGTKPDEGGVNICLYCGHLQVYHDNQWREPTDQELFDIATDPFIKRLQAERKKLVKENKL